MEINIKPDDIDNFVKDALLKSSIGTTFNASLEKALKEVFSGYNSPLKIYIQDIINEEIRKQILENEIYLSKIKEEVRKLLDEKTLMTFVGKFIDGIDYNFTMNDD